MKGMVMYDHWNTEHRERLSQLQDLHEAAQMGIEMLAALRERHKRIAILCGPMTTGGLGSLDANMERFILAQAALRTRGVMLFDQVPFQEVIIRVTDHHRSTAYNTAILDVFYRRIFESGHIAHAWFLPGWEDSVGATWERDFLSTLPEVSIAEFPIGYLSQELA